jgi:hypothetical protein
VAKEELLVDEESRFDAPLAVTVEFAPHSGLIRPDEFEQEFGLLPASHSPYNPPALLFNHTDRPLRKEHA